MSPQYKKLSGSKAAAINLANKQLEIEKTVLKFLEAIFPGKPIDSLEVEGHSEFNDEGGSYWSASSIYITVEGKGYSLDELFPYSEEEYIRPDDSDGWAPSQNNAASIALVDVLLKLKEEGASNSVASYYTVKQLSDIRKHLENHPQLFWSYSIDENLIELMNDYVSNAGGNGAIIKNLHIAKDMKPTELYVQVDTSSNA